jgi:hypothetical protein
MFMYPIIQLAMTATLNQIGSGLSNNQFLFDDLFVVLVLAVLMLRSGPVRTMGPVRPTDNLFSPYILCSIAGQLIICIGFFVMNYVSMTEQNQFCSISNGTSGVNHLFKPLNSTAPSNITYPCYV